MHTRRPFVLRGLCSLHLLLPCSASFNFKAHLDILKATSLIAFRKMGLKTTPPTDTHHGNLVRPSNDSEEIFHPANESSAPATTDNMDTGDGDAHDRSPSDPKEELEPTNEVARVESSISIQSLASTLQYEQEPFDSYQTRVKALCHEIWPPESRAAAFERRVSSVSKPRILDGARVKRFRRFLFPSAEKEFLIERLAGGTYNRIVSITVKAFGGNDPKNFILRAPRPNMAWYGCIEREVAILRYVRHNTTLPVADVISFDTTTKNPLESGYVIQSRLPGVPLHTIWDDLTHDQRCTIAQELGKVILALQKVKQSEPGVVEASLAEDGSQKFQIRPFDIKPLYNNDRKPKIPNDASDGKVAGWTQTPLEWFGTQFGRWLAYELLASPAQILYWDYQLQFVQAAKQMERFGYLGDGQNCLCHFDLAARNILVQILPNGSPSITGIVDWDSAAFAPTFVSCAPPFWLWSDEEYYDEGTFEPSMKPSTPELEEIKEMFEEVVGFDWEWFAYQPGFRMARELFDFARHGNQDGSATKRAQRLLKEWAALYDSKCNPQDHDENSDEDEEADGSAGGDAIQESEAMDIDRQNGA